MIPHPCQKSHPFQQAINDSSSTTPDVQKYKIWDRPLEIAKSYDRDKFRLFSFKEIDQQIEIFEKSILGCIDSVFNSFFAEG